MFLICFIFIIALNVNRKLPFVLIILYFQGIVKSALDGGAVVIRGQPRNGPPPERVLALTNIDTRRLGEI